MAKVIMIQGTMSNAGKSFLVAGLCRLFRQDGYRVAPFKSQNMALNSFITRDGLEMGRAQVMQAEAAGVEPDVRMNPILLKPTNEMGSQVIVNGEVCCNMSAKEYFAYKKQLIPNIKKAYESLAEDYDIIVIEGAGSPAEINLKQDDIVNMGMARLAGAPVLLVGDIDRGGVFAQLYGTMALLEEQEQDMIKGLVINKFRGDRSILEPGIIMLEERCQKPVIGVVPYSRVQLEDEDSLSEKLSAHHFEDGQVASIDIVVIRLPRISNFTDCDVLMQIPGVSVRYVDKVSNLGEPDMVILPGSKNTMRDLLWMRQNGIEARIMRLKMQGCLIFGICGGYQMLGEKIEDPQGVEEGGTIRGMGLLPIETVFAGEKQRTRVKGKMLTFPGIFAPLSGLSVGGYEIHMGTTHWRGEEKHRAVTRICDEVSGQEKLDGAFQDNVFGTYIHGFFDGEQIATSFVKILAEKKGISMNTITSFDYHAFKEQQYDLLAKVIRENMDIAQIYRILEEGI